MMRPPADLLDANETAGKIQTMPEPKKHRKTTNLNMRIDPQLKAEFSAIAEREDVSAGHALRAFMRRYIAKHRGRNQAAKDGNGLDQSM